MSRRRATRLAGAALAGAAAWGCYYDPDIPSGAFRCGDTQPRCPEGQIEATARNGQCVCVNPGELPDGAALPPDGGGDARADATPERHVDQEVEQVQDVDNSCADVRAEPQNNSFQRAFDLTQVGVGPTFAGEICYPGDVDFWAWPVRAGARLRVEVGFRQDLGDLDAGLLDPAGNLVFEALSQDDDELLEMPAAAAEDGLWRVVVAGYRDAVNEYTLRIETVME